jgi:hypothetical protein
LPPRQDYDIEPEVLNSPDSLHEAGKFYRLANVAIGMVAIGFEDVLVGL